MKIYKRTGSPSWFVDLVHPTTKTRMRKSLRFNGSKVEAQKRARRLEAELEDAAQLTTGQFPIAVRGAVGNYIAYLEAHGKPSAVNQRYRAARLFGSAAGAHETWVLPPATWLHDLTPALLEELVLARRREGKKAQTIKHELGLLSAAGRYAVALGFRGPEKLLQSGAKNPWRIPKVPQKTRYLSPEEFKKVHRHLDPARPITTVRRGTIYALPKHLAKGRQDAQDLLVALAYTGGRWSEVAGLTWDRVDFERGSVRLYGSKSGGKDRLAPMAAPLRAVLKRRSARGLDKPHLVFPSPSGGVRKAPSGAIGDAMTACGLNDPDTVAKHGTASVHSLRHTFASWLIQNGADLVDVKEALGHSSVVMTTRYAHLQGDKMVAKLTGILDGIGQRAPQAAATASPSAPTGVTSNPA